MKTQTHLAPQTTLGTLAADHPTLIPWFFEQKWDFCCGGNRPLKEVAAESARDVDSFIAEIQERIDTLPINDETTLPKLSNRQPVELIAYILKRFHEPHREVFPGLRRMADKVTKVHGAHYPWLADLKKILDRLIDDLIAHMLREEQALFPMIRHLGTAQAASYGCGGGNPTLPMKVMRAEHEEAAVLMERMVGLTSNFTPPPDACATFIALFAALAELDQELRLHMHLENNVLFPMVARDLANQEA